jgi:hypothetical protein
MLLSILRVLSMARTAILIFLFAALSIVGASGAQRHNAKAHHASVAAVRHHVSRPQAAHRRAHRNLSHPGQSLRAHSTRASRRAKRVPRLSQKRTASIHHLKSSHSPVVPAVKGAESEPAASPQQSARLRNPHDPLDRTTRSTATALNTREPSGAALPTAALRDDADEAEARELEPEADPAGTNLSPIEGEVPSPLAVVSLRATRITPVAPLHGSLASLIRQNERTDADHLERIENDADLRDRIARGMLVPVPTSAALAINQDLPSDHRYCRPWTARFLADLARAHNAVFHRPLEVSSAVRTVDYQKRLMGVNGNAAPAEGDVVSPHVTGATIDIAKGGLTQREIYWMRGRLLALQQEGKLDVEEEFQQACFHITVYKSYLSTHGTRRARLAVPPTPVSAVGLTAQQVADTASE